MLHIPSQSVGKDNRINETDIKNPYNVFFAPFLHHHVSRIEDILYMSGHSQGKKTPYIYSVLYL